MMVLSRERIEAIVGTHVNDMRVYQTAFTHKSALKQYSVHSSYERLEFLGDAVLSFVITKHLYDTWQDEDEGFLTRIRTKLVCGKNLAAISTDLNLGSMVLMDEKGLRNEWNKNEKILEDVLEALIGAIYIDLGIIHAKHFIFRHILSRTMDMDDDNYKDQLMRWCQANRLPLPVYQIVSSVNKTFVVTVWAMDLSATGSGKTKKAAEQCAALEFIRSFSHLDINGPKGGAYTDSECGSSGSEVS